MQCMQCSACKGMMPLGAGAQFPCNGDSRSNRRQGLMKAASQG
jgi:hypothetical protein